MRFTAMMACVLLVAGCSSSGKSSNTARYERYINQCTAAGVSAGSVAMQNCVYEKEKQYQNQLAADAARAHARQMEQIRRNSMVDSR